MLLIGKDFAKVISNMPSPVLKVEGVIWKCVDIFQNVFTLKASQHSLILAHRSLALISAKKWTFQSGTNCLRLRPAG